MVFELYPVKKVTFCRFSVVEREGERERERERVGRESGTVTCHVSMFKCPGLKFVGKVWNFFVLLLDDVTSWWMFKWRSGALARAQIRIEAIRWQGFWNLRTIPWQLHNAYINEWIIRISYKVAGKPPSPCQRSFQVPYLHTQQWWWWWLPTNRKREYCRTYTALLPLYPVP